MDVGRVTKSALIAAVASLAAGDAHRPETQRAREDLVTITQASGETVREMNAAASPQLQAALLRWAPRRYYDISCTRHTVLFTDLKGSTEMYDRLGEFRAFARVSHHLRIMQYHVEQAGGKVVKCTGDGLMAVFDKPSHAVLAAVRMRDESVRIGIHDGICMETETGDVFGQTVNIASRIMGLANPGEICLSDPVMQPGLPTRAEVSLLKGIQEPVRVHRYRGESAEKHPGTDPRAPL